MRASMLLLLCSCWSPLSVMHTCEPSACMPCNKVERAQLEGSDGAACRRTFFSSSSPTICCTVLALLRTSPSTAIACEGQTSLLHLAFVTGTLTSMHCQGHSCSCTFIPGIPGRGPKSMLQSLLRAYTLMPCDQTLTSIIQAESSFIIAGSAFGIRGRPQIEAP